MLAFPHAKINLGLHVTSRRSDGYHNIETILLPVSLYDALEILEAPDNKTSLFLSGLTLPQGDSPNLCLQAFHRLRDRYKLPPIHIYLHKCIPAGAGLGGGSSNAAFALILLNKLFGLNLSKQNLKEEAGMLGSDCPFFIESQAMLASGKGDQLRPVSIPGLTGMQLIIITPPLHVSTARAYAGVTPQQPIHSLSSIITKPVSEWTGLLKNDFEVSVFSLFPEIEAIKNKLSELGALYASMSGSGSSVFALFKESPDARMRQAFPDCRIYGPFLL